MWRIFVDRPVFAWVLSIFVMAAGVWAVLFLPIEKYPDVAPISVNISANYPGASAETLETSVTQIVEQHLTGLDGLIYFSSTANSQGGAGITATFEKGTDPDIAQVQIQNRVQEVLPRLPLPVQQQGVSVTKSVPDYLLILSIYDTTDQSTDGDVADYVVSNLQDQIARLPGVGELRVFGAQYAMRIWLDPYKLAGYGLIPADVRAAVMAQNTQVAAGQIGARPAPAEPYVISATVTAKSRLQTPDQFRRIIVKAERNGARVVLGDVARVELGSEEYSRVTRVNRHPGTSMGILLAPGADALETAERVKAAIQRQAKAFPPGFAYALARDGTTFIRASIEKVAEALGEAILFVVFVMFAFLQSWRATLIPALAVPVVVLGTLGVLAAFGFTINTLTLFGLVLAIGLLVDDAIVVVENVDRVLRENPGMQPREATIQSMGEIQTALIAIALVLSAVFLPMAFFGGSLGVIYRQFSITIVASMLLSVIVAFVLTPALTASLLKGEEHRSPEHSASPRLGWSAALVKRSVACVVTGHQRGLRRILDWQRWGVAAFLGIGALLAGLLVQLPTSFLPSEDEGAATVQYTLPAGATLDRSLRVGMQIEDYLLSEEKGYVQTVTTVTGFTSGGSGQNAGVGFILLTPWDKRPQRQNAADELAHRISRRLSSVRDARVVAYTPPPVRGLGLSTGFTLQLLNSGNLSRQEFKAARDRLLTRAVAAPEFAAVRANGLDDTMTLNIDIDEEKVAALGVAQAEVYDTLSAAWGGVYVNDFLDRGRVKGVYMQGDAPFRAIPTDLGAWSVRSADGRMISFSTFARTSWSSAPAILSRFGGLPSYEIVGQAAPGYSSGEAMTRIAALAEGTPGITVGWSGVSYQEKKSGGQAPLLYALSVLAVFLFMAALYESWSVPLAVLLFLPGGLVGAVVAVWLRGLPNDIYFQIGLLTTMGLSAKNAILIVEFAERAVAEGRTAVDAAIAAARLRLRPILMTSIAFMFGALPLAISSGPGAQSRTAIGTAVLGGVLAGTVLAIFYVPLFFVLVHRFFKRSMHAERHLSAMPRAHAE